MSKSFYATVFKPGKKVLETQIINLVDFDYVIERLKTELRNKEILGFFISSLSNVEEEVSG